MIWNYSATPLTMPGGSLTGEAIAVSDPGMIVGWVDESFTSRTLPVLWDTTGSPTVLNSSSATYGGKAYDINSAGVAVGALYGYGSTALGALWQGPATFKLHPLPGDADSEALGINDRGVIVGASSGLSGRRAVVWMGPGPSKSVHPGGVWTESQAEDVNDQGDIAGWVRNASGVTHAFLWHRNGTTADLGPGGRIRAWNAQAFGINNATDVAGRTTVRLSTTGTAWYASTQVSHFALSDATLAYAISDNYRVVGSFTPLNGYSVAFAATTPFTYDALPGAPPNYSNQAEAYDVNFCGTIVGWLQRFNVGRRPVKWVKAGCDES
ncbi:MAG: hypothetical protein H7066_07710 [Cytophagaceae bacterium]|nr:hypothetical protein [Gemmatimonadaceae bacterium]